MVNRRILLTTLGLVMTCLPLTQTQAFVTDGVASYYGEGFHGRPTASGERFDMGELTAAHRSWRFGTRVLVTNKVNGQTVEVTINDRGPFIRGRTIDLSKEAARQLGMLNRGVAPVELEIVGVSEPGKGSRADYRIDKAQEMMMELF